MKIAIIGAGLAGVATAYHLQRFSKDVQITLFDPNGIGGAASKAATGLLHPYPGKHGRKSLYGHAAYLETQHLLHTSQKLMNQPIVNWTPVEKRLDDLSSPLTKHSDVKHLQGNQFLILPSCVVYTQSYLQGLFLACKNVILIQEKIDPKNELLDFDAVVIAAGFGIRDFISCDSLRLRMNKGQVLLARHQIPRSVLGPAYIAQGKNRDTIHIGSTYEHNQIDEVPNLKMAKDLLKVRASSTLPNFSSLEFLGVKAGVRVTQMGTYLPLIKKCSDRNYLFTALGSRGLLYHAYYAKKLAKAILFKENM